MKPLREYSGSIGRRLLWSGREGFSSLDRRIRAALARPAGKPVGLLRALGRLTTIGARAAEFGLSRTRPSRQGSSGARAEYLFNYFHQLGALVQGFPLQPKISILIPLHRVDPAFFRETLSSVAAQIYANWEACIVDDCSGDPRLAELARDFEARHPGRVKFAVNDAHGHVCRTSNRCLELASGEYVGLLDHDDRLYPNALAEMVRYINLESEPDLLYSDEEHIDRTGLPFETPFFKPDWSPYLHLSVHYTTHLTLYRTDLVRRIGGFRPGFEGSQDYDLMLRAVEATSKPVVHVPFCLYQWRVHQDSTAAGGDAKPYAAVAGEKALTEALTRRNHAGSVEFQPTTSHYRLRFPIPTPAPRVSIIIPTKNRLDLISRCVTSILEKSTYPDFEVVVVDNGTTDAECLAYLDGLATTRAGTVRVLRDPGPFNFARLNNLGARHATGEFILLLNNDTEVLEPAWLEEMVMLAQWPDVGAVGAKLLYPDGRIQHAGVVLCGRNIGTHTAKGSLEDDPFPLSLQNTLHDATAVSAACLMIRKRLFEEVGALDELYVPNAYGDVDLCLRLQAKGLTNVYTPWARLFHHESPSRGERTPENFEHFYFYQKWGYRMLNEPGLGPNLARRPSHAPDFFFCNLLLDRDVFRFLLNAPRDQWNRSAFERSRFGAARM